MLPPCEFAPLAKLVAETSMPASKRLGFGLLVISRRVPDRALAPYSVPCGPDRASTRCMS